MKENWGSPDSFWECGNLSLIFDGWSRVCRAGKRSQLCGREGNQGSLHLKADLPFFTPDELSIQLAGSPPPQQEISQTLQE